MQVTRNEEQHLVNNMFPLKKTNFEFLIVHIFFYNKLTVLGVLNDECSLLLFSLMYTSFDYLPTCLL